MLVLSCVLAALFIPSVLSKKPVYTKEQLDSIPPVNYSLSTASKSDVIYYLFTNSTQEEGLEINAKTADIDASLPTKLLLHGFTTDATSPWFPLLKEEYFKKGPHNVIYVDWSKAGNLTYAKSSANVDPVGEYIADFLIGCGIPPANVHLIGHSLGSHVTGFVGKHVWKKAGKKIGRITALDPARPSFHNLPENLRLCSLDADFVDVIHTDMDYFGLTHPAGHVDFYPNGGRNQPGVKPREEDDNGSHARSTLFFIESVNCKRMKAKKAELNDKQEVLVVEGDVEEIIFGDATPKSARGVYYFETGSSPPFLDCDNNNNT